MIDKFTPSIIEEIEKQSYVSMHCVASVFPRRLTVCTATSQVAADEIMTYGGTDITIGLWPFTDSMFDKATPSAWPHETGKPSCPINVYFTWEGKENDAYWVENLKKTLDTLRETVHRERPSSKDLATFISAACVEATTVEDLYRGNLDVLKRIRRKYDEHGVMDLAGGFRIPRA